MQFKTQILRGAYILDLLNNTDNIAGKGPQGGRAPKEIGRGGTTASALQPQGERTEGTGALDWRDLRAGAFFQ